MEYVLTILRKERNSNKQTWESFSYTSTSKSETVASALLEINKQTPLLNINGEPSRKIEWDCGCLQKKCGACAMVICGNPRLACDAKLCEFKDGIIKIEPLRKFPVVCDLIVDRSILFENLKTLGLWLREDANLSDYYRELAFEASRCVQCGICLEVCPNFYAGGSFFGMATVPVTLRLLTEMDKKEFTEIAKQYNKHTFEGCGKSLACKNACPRKIDTEKLLVNANAIAVWKRKRNKK